MYMNACLLIIAHRGQWLERCDCVGSGSFVALGSFVHMPASVSVSRQMRRNVAFNEYLGAGKGRSRGGIPLYICIVRFTQPWRAPLCGDLVRLLGAKDLSSPRERIGKCNSYNLLDRICWLYFGGEPKLNDAGLTT